MSCMRCWPEVFLTAEQREGRRKWSAGCKPRNERQGRACRDISALEDPLYLQNSETVRLQSFNLRCVKEISDSYSVLLCIVQFISHSPNVTYTRSIVQFISHQFISHQTSRIVQFSHVRSIVQYSSYLLELLVHTSIVQFLCLIVQFLLLLLY